MTEEAQVHRAQLWHAIRHAKGFQGSFEHWWPMRNIKSQGLPTVLPSAIPNAQLARLIVDEFQLNYRQFEAWNIRRKMELLDLSYQACVHKIFKVVKPDSKPQLTFLQYETVSTVLGVDDTGQHIHLSDPVPTDTNVQYFIDGVEATIEKIDEPLYWADADCLFIPGQTVTAQQTFSSTADLHRVLKDFWEPRWCRLQEPTSSDWRRIMAFAQTHLPPGLMQYAPIDEAQWQASNRRYTDRSARGPDGFSKSDVCNMPPAFVRELLAQVNTWEQHSQWPMALQAGYVLPQAKRDISLTAGDFRPIVIFPMYRTWSSVRAKQALRFLHKHASSHQFGYVPQAEVAEIFYMTQALIEIDVLRQSSRCGLVTDLQKAFECLPRDPVWQVARWVGLPGPLLDLWSTYLTNMTRYFRIGHDLGPPLQSTSGFPEGCALSCVAMGLVSLCMHAYMRAFHPRAICLSFVDNITLIARSAFDLQAAQIGLLTWTQMWGLALDDAKTFVWGTDPSIRASLTLLQRQIVTSAKDLGAQMQYGKKHAVVDQLARLEALRPLWGLLQRCKAPLYQKQHLLQQAFWPKVFFDIAICRLGFTHIKRLRTQAVTALGHRKAGASPAVRLFLPSPCLCDPGFYQCWHVLVTFRRLWHKQPRLATLWDEFASRYEGAPTEGPFGKLLETFDRLGWAMASAPWVCTQDSIWIDLAWLDEDTLRSFLEDAWMQFIASDLQKRKDFTHLTSIDYRLVKHALKAPAYHDLACLQVLREGAFVDSQQTKRFDMTQSGLCPHCQSPDSLRHRLCDCPSFQDIHTQHEHAVQLARGAEDFYALHLLPPKMPHWEPFWQSLNSLPDRPQWTNVSLHASDVHLFTDGSCLLPSYPALALATWSIVSATHDCRIAAGPLPGLAQNSDRAELYAILLAVQWATLRHQPSVIWTDSAYAATGLHRLLTHIADVPKQSNCDLWLQLQSTLKDATVSIRVQHIAAHRDPAVQPTELDIWTATWNGRADRAAARAHIHRPEALTTAWMTLREGYRHALHDMIALQNLHIAISKAARERAPTSVAPEPDEIESDSHDQMIPQRDIVFDPWCFTLPDDWETSDELATLGA